MSNTEPAEIDINHLRSWIGRQEQGADIVTPALLQRFRATVEGFTALQRGNAESIPLGMHWCLAIPSVAQEKLGSDGHPGKGGFLPPVPLPRRMWAASQIRFHHALRLNTEIEKQSTIADIVLKESATSGPLVFVHIDHRYDQNFAGTREKIIEERQTIVYRSASTFVPAVAQNTALPSQGMEIYPDNTLLFRYSALTFNAHRIHYDQHYTTREEGYPGLVVQGPLMATLLMNFAQSKNSTQTLQTFEFRATAPAFAAQTLQLTAHGNNAVIANAEGATIMTAVTAFTQEQ